jgi:hypothetical protein
MKNLFVLCVDISLGVKTVATIKLSRGEVAIVDDEDFSALSQFKWHLRQSRVGGTKYAEHSYRLNGRKDNFSMHQLVMLFPEKDIDHINGNGLDNRKENLRLCSNSQNHMNIPKMRGNFSSKYKGVSRRGKKWRATIRKNGQHKEIGLFTTELDAAKAYDCAAIDLFGAFASVNGVYGADDKLVCCVCGRKPGFVETDRGNYE